jgi:hypothetical protein
LSPMAKRSRVKAPPKAWEARGAKGKGHMRM